MNKSKKQAKKRSSKTPELNSPYCPKCTGCGEDGCCSWYNCFVSLTRANKKCHYKESYLKEALLDKKCAEAFHEILSNLKGKKITAHEAIMQFDTKWNAIYDEMWRTNNAATK